MVEYLKFWALEIVLATDVYAGISATMALWLAVIVWVHCTFVITHKYRYSNWWKISPRERADAVLNIAAVGWFTYSLCQRINALYAFATREWSITPATSLVAPVYLPLGLAALSGWLWWACFQKFPDHQLWWLLWMALGLLAYAATVFLL